MQFELERSIPILPSDFHQSHESACGSALHQPLHILTSLPENSSSLPPDRVGNRWQTTKPTSQSDLQQAMCLNRHYSKLNEGVFGHEANLESETAHTLQVDTLRIPKLFDVPSSCHCYAPTMIQKSYHSIPIPPGTCPLPFGVLNQKPKSDPPIFQGNSHLHWFLSITC